MTLAEYYDLENILCSAAVDAVSTLGIPALEMLRGGSRDGLRAEIVANLLEQLEDETFSAQGEPMRYRYRLALAIEIRGPISQYDAHREARGRLRSHLSYPQGLAFLESRMTHHQVFEISLRETSNTAESELSEYDELVTQMLLEVVLHQTPGKRP